MKRTALVSDLNDWAACTWAHDCTKTAIATTQHKLQPTKQKFEELHIWLIHAVSISSGSINNEVGQAPATPGSPGLSVFVASAVLVLGTSCT
jgi:hypothetical protein